MPRELRESAVRGRIRLFCLLLAPAPALGIGLIVMARAGVSPALWLWNLAAALAGVLVVLVAARWNPPAGQARTSSRWLVVGGLALLGATLLAPGVDGVRRWLPLGPMDLHVGAVVLPPLLVVVAGVGWTPGVASSVLALTILLVQPDAAQAASFAAGWSVLMSLAHGRRALAPVAAAAVLAGLALLRHDPLETVPHVEGIVGIATAQHLVWGAGSVIALALLPVSFLLQAHRPAGAALAAYTTGTLVAAWLGNHPVPVLGYGVSPILGYYLGVAALCDAAGVQQTRAPSRTAAAACLRFRVKAGAAERG